MRDRRAWNAVTAAGLLVLCIAGCAGGERRITPADRAAVDKAMSAITAPSGYERAPTCSVPEGWCFSSDLTVPSPATPSFHTLLEGFGLTVVDKDIHCDAAVSTKHSGATCYGAGEIGVVEFSVTLVSADLVGPSRPRRTSLVIAPAAIKT